MDDVKTALASRAVWGGLIAIGAGIAALFGYRVDPAVQSDILNELVAIGAVAGGATAIYGRIKATKRIGR